MKMIIFSALGGELCSWVVDFTISVQKDYLPLDYITNLNWAPLHEGVMLSYAWLSKICLLQLSTIVSASFGDRCLGSDTVLKTLGRSLQMAVCFTEFSRWVWELFAPTYWSWVSPCTAEFLGNERNQWLNHICNEWSVTGFGLHTKHCNCCNLHKNKELLVGRKKCQKTLFYR